MLQVSNLNKAYGPQILFDNASFTLSSGERVGLVGRNGHGKTTLFKIILGEESADSGTIKIPSGYRIGHLSQNIVFQKDTVLEEGTLSLPPSDEGWDETYKVETILFGLGFGDNDLQSNPNKLSGGFQVRLNLAKVLITHPNLLLLDEPTNYLDIVSVRWLIRFLAAWKNELIIITHDRDFMDRVTTHTMGIHRLKIRKFVGPTQKFQEQITQEELIHEQSRVNQGKKRKEVEQFIDRFRAKASKAKAVQSRVKALDKIEKLEELREIKSLDFRFNSLPFTGKWSVVVEYLSFSFSPEGPLLIRNFSVTIGKKDRIAIIGKNGKGKTTLMNLIAGELSPLAGSITRHTNLRLGYFGQMNIDRLHREKTVEEEILSVHPDHSRGAARKICGLMMFEGNTALKRVRVLSGGEKSRVLLGKLLVSPTNFLLLDEPTNHLDMYSIDSLVEAIHAFDGTLVVVTHSELILQTVATRLIVFDGGEVTVFEGTYRDFLERVGWQEENILGKQQQSIPASGLNPAKKKELRQVRAEIIAQKASVLKPLEKKIIQTEKRIMELEKELAEKNVAILIASEANDNATIAKLSWTIHDLKQEIDGLFEHLEIVSTQRDIRLKEFETRLEELG